MAKPTISTVLPAVLHTGGRTVVEITGANFRLPEEPAATPYPAPEQKASVRVLFGDVEAEDVAVAGDDLLYAIVPEHDPGQVSVTVENLDGAPARLTSSAEPFALADGETLEVSVDGKPAQVVTFATAQFADIGAATAVEVAAAVGAVVRGVLVRVAGGAVVVETDSRGGGAKLLVAGSARAALGFSPSETTGDDDVREPLPGESTTLANAVTFKRPHLGAKSGLALAIEAYRKKLERQVIPNVHMATHVEYDEQTGDGWNVSFAAQFPALVITDVSLPRNTEAANADPLELPTTDGTGFVAKRPPSVRDVVMTIVGVCETTVEVLNLTAVMDSFFQKNNTLRVQRDPGNAALGYVEYDIEGAIGEAVKVTRESGNVPMQGFAMSAAIRGVLIEDIPLEAEGPAPAGVRPGMAQEATQEIGSTNETMELSLDGIEEQP